MIWTKYTIKTTTKDADMVSAILMDYDINDVQIENNVQLTDEELTEAGIHRNTIRLSIGTEHIDDIIADLENGFAAV